MRVRLLLFASYQDAAGAAELAAELREGATVDDCAQWLIDRHPQFARLLPLGRIAVNLDVVDSGHPVNEGDDIAFMPPMSGG